MTTNGNHKRKAAKAKNGGARRASAGHAQPFSADAEETNTISDESEHATLGANVDEGSDFWLWVLAAMAAAGAGLAIVKHKEAKEHKAAADRANERSTVDRADAQKAKRHAQDMEAKADKERERADLAEKRVIKLVEDVANHAHHLIARLRGEMAPPLHFDKCFAAATNRLEIRIAMD